MDNTKKTAMMEYFRIQQLSDKEIISLGEKISNGYGFWGHVIRQGNYGRVADSAWITALRHNKFSDTDIACYGDWRDGRHIANYMSEYENEFDMIKTINDCASDLNQVKSTNDKEYMKDVFTWFKVNKKEIYDECMKKMTIQEDDKAINDGNEA